MRHAAATPNKSVRGLTRLGDAASKREDEVILKASILLFTQPSRTATHGRQIRVIALQISVSMLRDFNLNERARAISNSRNRTDNRRPALCEAVLVKPALDHSCKRIEYLPFAGHAKATSRPESSQAK